MIAPRCQDRTEPSGSGDLLQRLDTRKPQNIPAPVFAPTVGKPLSRRDGSGAQ
ncbi:MAG: hypothetical protein GXY83_11390 [Rhodopirellula sp.]|nr:hypothetical protein [Rhodopirellula sp.]